MSKGAEREWKFYLDDMIGFAEKVIAYTEGLDQERFVDSGLNYDATIRNLELISNMGSASNLIIHSATALNVSLFANTEIRCL